MHLYTETADQDKDVHQWQEEHPVMTSSFHYRSYHHQLLSTAVESHQISAVSSKLTWTEGDLLTQDACSCLKVHNYS